MISHSFRLVNDDVLAMYKKNSRCKKSLFFKGVPFLDEQIIIFSPMGMYEVIQPAVFFAGYLRLAVSMARTCFGK